MNHPSAKWQKHEQGTLILLVILSLAGIIYVSSNFIFNILFATIMTLSTYPFFLKLKEKFDLNNTKAALYTTLGVGVILIAPISYVLTILGVETFQLYNIFQSFISELDFSTKESAVNSVLAHVKISEEYINMIKPLLIEHVDISNIVKTSKDVLLFISQNAIGSFLGTFGFFAIALFTMFFLYRDGEQIADKIKQISPLHDYYDSLLMRELTRLSGILTLSVLTIAFIQGAAFSILTAFMDLNWLFIGVAIALTSFIPIVGTFIVWFPLGLYLILTGHTIQGGLVIFWGAVVTGTIIDNILRPIIVGYICNIFDSEDIDSEIKKEEEKNFNPLNHTLIVTISTLGGIFNFGVIGLFIGPIIAGISITVLELYRIRLNNAEPAVIPVEDIHHADVDLDQLVDRANEEQVNDYIMEQEVVDIDQDFNGIEEDIDEYDLEHENDNQDDLSEDEFDNLTLEDLEEEKKKK